jgi:hypothetical protein
MSSPPNVITHIFLIALTDLKQIPTVCFADLDQASKILGLFSLPKSMKHTVCVFIHK